MTAVFMSRHQETVAPFQKGYGAFIDWKPGERVTVLSSSGRPPTGGTLVSGIMTHDGAPEFEGAHGVGRWICEVRIDGQSGLFTIPTRQLTLPRPEHASSPSRAQKSPPADSGEGT